MSSNFTDVARLFVSVVESPVSIKALRAALADLYAAGLRLGSDYSDEGWQGDWSPTAADREALCRNLARLFSGHLYHVVISDPFHAAESPELGIGDAMDDVADVWTDIKTGLIAIERGVPEEAAHWHWKLLFDIHWGTHAIELLAALHRSAR